MDQLVFIFLTLMYINCTRVSDDVVSVIVIVNGLMIPFYTMTYRQYYCQEFITATRLLGDRGIFKYFNIGVTECCLIQYGTMFYFAS